MKTNNKTQLPVLPTNENFVMIFLAFFIQEKIIKSAGISNMPEIVRIAVGEDIPKLAWPECCAQCGTTKQLVPLTTRLGKVNSMRPNLLGGLTVRSQLVYLTFKMCPQHVGATRMANRILSNSPVMMLVRGILYFGGVMALQALLLLATDPATAIALLRAQFGLALIPIFGALGLWTLFWARSATSLRPIRFDPDRDIIEVRFAQEKYAAKFRLLNLEATNAQNTESAPWYQKSVVWYCLLTVFAIIVLSRAIHL